MSGHSLGQVNKDNRPRLALVDRLVPINEIQLCSLLTYLARPIELPQLAGFGPLKGHEDVTACYGQIQVKHAMQ